ncbi:hypothetical protein VTI74DRAFT_8287 [Chaetomium olivicolor]
MSPQPWILPAIPPSPLSPWNAAPPIFIFAGHQLQFAQAPECLPGCQPTADAQSRLAIRIPRPWLLLLLTSSGKAVSLPATATRRGSAGSSRAAASLRHWNGRMRSNSSTASWRLFVLVTAKQHCSNSQLNKHCPAAETSSRTSWPRVSSDMAVDWRQLADALILPHFLRGGIAGRCLSIVQVLADPPTSWANTELRCALL